MQQGFSQLARILTALGAFVALLCVLIYVGFEIKFQRFDMKGLTGAKQSLPAMPDPLFYKSIGSISSKDLNRISGRDAQMGQRYTLEIRMTKSRREAEAIVDQLAEQGVQAYYTPLQRNGRVVYRVRRGIYTSMKLAKRAATELKIRKKLNVRIVQLN